MGHAVLVDSVYRQERAGKLKSIKYKNETYRSRLSEFAIGFFSLCAEESGNKKTLATEKNLISPGGKEGLTKPTRLILALMFVGKARNRAQVPHQAQA